MRQLIGFWTSALLVACGGGGAGDQDTLDQDTVEHDTAADGDAVPDGDAASETAVDSGAGEVDAASPDPVTVLSVEPPAASFRGGARVILRGDNLDRAGEVRFGDAVASVDQRTPTSLEVTVPAAASGGATTIVLDTPDGPVAWDGFRYLGIPPPALRLVELPDGSTPALGVRVLALPGKTAPRVAVLGPDALALFAVTPDGPAHLWTAEEPPADIAAACAADFDGDGRDDLWLAAVSGGGLWRGGDAGLSAPTAGPALPATEAVCTDLTDDGVPDVLVAVAPPGTMPTLRLLRGDGDGGFEAGAVTVALGGQALGLAVADVDGDGRVDVLVGRLGLAPRLLLGDGFGGLADAPAGSLPAGGVGAAPALGDLDGDGRVDAVLVGDGGVSVWMNSGGRFANHSALAQGLASDPGGRAQLVDVDVDGAPDVWISARDGGVALLRNDGAGRLFDYSDALIAWVGRAPLDAAALVDADADGDPDVVGLRVEAGQLTLLSSWDPAPFLDPDLDGVPTGLDGCPGAADPGQRNRDAWHFACDSAADCAAATGCRLEVLADDARAYLICGAPTVAMADAATFCEARGAALLVLDDEAEHAAVDALVTGRYWMALSDAGEEGTWLVTHGDAAGAPAPLLQWGDNQPDNAGAAGEHCVELIAPADAAAVFNDLPCDIARGFICEADVRVPEPDPQDACDVCPGVHDPAQLDSDGDGIGDACQAPEAP